MLTIFQLNGLYTVYDFSSIIGTIVDYYYIGYKIHDYCWLGSFSSFFTRRKPILTHRRNENKSDTPNSDYTYGVYSFSLTSSAATYKKRQTTVPIQRLLLHTGFRPASLPRTSLFFFFLVVEKSSCLTTASLLPLYSLQYRSIPLLENSGGKEWRQRAAG